MSKIKTLFITSIYANLWGTEFGGRASRHWHYRQSLVNILNMAPDKCICFTSESEYDDLSKYFYEENNISKDVLELRIFDLNKTKYVDQIKNKYDVEFMKLHDRSYVIQYNKFFWFDKIKNIFEYDRVYWIDAGLSYHGLFPEEFVEELSPHAGYYKINLFTNKVLNKINEKTSDNILVLCKNNANEFYWQRALPEKYYKQFDNKLHVIGGFFGGPPHLYKEYKLKFQNLLKRLLKDEPELYHEEQLMSCLYQNYKHLFVNEFFDDWYRRNPDDTDVRYFYNMFVDLNE